MSNQISHLYKAVLAPVAATQDAHAERLRRVHQTASLLYNRMVANIEYGEKKMKDIVQKEAKE